MSEAQIPYQTEVIPVAAVLQRGETLEPVISFANAIIETSSFPGRVFMGHDLIDLGRHHASLEELIMFTVYDPRHREAAREYCIEKDGRVMANNRPFVGENDLSVNIRFRKNVQNGSVAHTHSGDSIYSDNDLGGLLGYDMELGSTSSEVLLTPERTFILFRGIRTPFVLDPIDSLEKIRNKVLHELKHRIKAGLMNDFESGEEEDKEVFREFVRIFGFQVFEGGVGDRFLRRMPTDKIAR